MELAFENNDDVTDTIMLCIVLLRREFGVHHMTHIFLVQLHVESY